MGKKPNKRAKCYAFPISVLQLVVELSDGLDLSVALDQAIKCAIWQMYASKAEINGDTDEDGEPIGFILEHYQDTIECLGLKPHNEPDWAINLAKCVFDNYKDSKVYTAIDYDTFWDVKHNNNPRGEFYKEQVIAALALRSILGSWCDRMCKAVCWDFVLSRMAGEAKRVPQAKLPRYVKKYASRKMRKKMIDALCDYWGYSYYAPRGTRVPWFGLGMTYYELEQYATEHKRRKRAENRK